jgi:hypothetical protein
MKKLKFIIQLFLLLIYSMGCTPTKDVFNEKLTLYEANKKYPFGQPNVKALPEIKEYDKLIGNCTCKSIQYIAGKAGDTLDLKWRWRYILNGYGVQDEGWFGNDTIQSAFISIRTLNPITKKWHVPFFTPNMMGAPNIWVGGKEGKKIVLKRNQKTQNGGEVESILTFSNITEKGFFWEGKIVNSQNNSTNIFWKIWCIKDK